MRDRVTPPTDAEIFGRLIETRNATLDILAAPDEPTAIADALVEIREVREHRAILMEQNAALSARLERTTDQNHRLQDQLREALALAKGGQ